MGKPVARFAKITTEKTSNLCEGDFPPGMKYVL